MKSQRRNKRKLYSFFNLDARWVWVVNATPLSPYPGNEPVLVVMEAGLIPGLVWTVAENLSPAGIRSPDRPARSKSLH